MRHRLWTCSSALGLIVAAACTSDDGSGQTGDGSETQAEESGSESGTDGGGYPSCGQDAPPENWALDLPGDEPVDVAVDGAGNVLVLGQNSLARVTPDGQTSWVVGHETGATPMHLAVDVQGLAYVADGRGDNPIVMSAYDTFGQQQWSINNDPLGDEGDAGGVAIGGNDTLFIAGNGLEAGMIVSVWLSLFNDAGELSWRHQLDADRIDDLSIVPGGTLYAGGALGSEAWVAGFDATGDVAWTWTGAGEGILALSAGSAGVAALIADAGAHRVQVLDGGGGVLWSTTTDATGPRGGLALDASGGVYGVGTVDFDGGTDLHLGYYVEGGCSWSLAFGSSATDSSDLGVGVVLGSSDSAVPMAALSEDGSSWTAGLRDYGR